MSSITDSVTSKSKIAGIFLLTLLSSVIYFNSLQGTFQFDDRSLLNREWVADLPSFNKTVALDSFLNRPVLLWTFAVNNHLDPKHTFGFHLTNLLLHILVTVLIFLILIRVQQFLPIGPRFSENENLRSIKKQATRALLFPFATALLFAVHPLNTDSVSYISSRSSLLATFFYLLTLYLFTEMLVPGRRPRQRLLSGLFILPAMYFAIASKLIAVTLPVIMILWFLIFFAPIYSPGLLQRLSEPKILWACFTAGIVLLCGVITGDLLYSPNDQGLALFGRIPYFLVQMKVAVFFYLKQFLFPFNLNVDSGFPFTRFSTDWTISFSIIFIIGIILTVFKWGNIWIKLGTAWFFLTLAPTSSFVPLNDLAVEHRMYLPMSLGLCLIGGWLVRYFSKTDQMRPFIFILIVCGVLTTARNESWISEINLWSDAALKNPNSPRVYNNLGKAYFKAGRLGIARVHLEKSVSNIPKYIKAQYNISSPEKFLSPRSRVKSALQNSGFSENDKLELKADFAEPHYNLASVYLDLGQLDKSENEYRTALALKPDYFSAELGLGSVKNIKGEYDFAIKHFLNSIILYKKATGQSDYALARSNLGEVYGKTRRYDKAIIELTRAIEADPLLVEAHFNLGTAYMLKGSYDKAENSFKNCLNLNSIYEPALFNLAQVYQKKNLWEDSNNIFEEFIKIKGPNTAAYSAMAWNSLMSEKIKQAKRLYEKVLGFEPDHQAALVNLAKINYQLGNNEISRSYIDRALKLDLPEPLVNELTQLFKKLSTF